MDPRFADIRDWIFDLDNCLYPASAGLFELIDERMSAYIQRLLDCDAAEARRVQKAHFHEHGTTLAGLMKEHGVDPHHFLADVHDIALDRVQCDERLARLLPRLPGRRFLFTNGDAPYARRVLERIGIDGHFDDLHDIHASLYRPKPDPHGYQLLCERFGIDPAHALLADDMVQNLGPAKALGMRTIWVDNGSERGNHNYEEHVVDVRIRDIGDWLESILGKKMDERLEQVIDRAWDERDSIGPDTRGELRQAVDAAIAALDRGEARIAESSADGWAVHQWLKKAVLLSFRLNPMEAISGAPGGAHWWDKVPSKFAGWGEKEFAAARFRAVPGAIVRRGAYVAPGAVLMPSFVNIGAYVGEGTMVDTWATVGSCAQIGRNVHISGGAGIGGVLEPLQAGPVIIEDDCFIGARSEVAEGVIVEKGSVLSMGVFLGASTRIVDRASGEVHYGRVPSYSVVVPGALPGREGGPALSCAVIVKRVDERTRSKTSINELLRE